MNDSFEDRVSFQPDPSVPWTPRDVAWGLAVFVLWISLFVIVSLLDDALALPIDPGLVILFGELVLLLPVWYFTVYKYGVGWGDLGLRRFRLRILGTGFGLVILALVLIRLYGNLLALFGLQVQPDIAVIFEATRFPLATFLGGAVVAPFVEEIFFRGFVFTGLRGKWNWQKAALASAALFAIAHVLPTSLLPIFALGLIFAYLYQASGSVWPPILMHVLINTLALSVAYAVSQGLAPVP